MLSKEQQKQIQKRMSELKKKNISRKDQPPELRKNAPQKKAE